MAVELPPRRDGVLSPCRSSRTAQFSEGRTLGRDWSAGGLLVSFVACRVSGLASRPDASDRLDLRIFDDLRVESRHQRGALDWKPRFKAAVQPLFHWLYDRVASGKETARVLESCGAPNYQEQLGRELAELGSSEMWRAGKATRALRPKELAKAISAETKGIGGRDSN